MSALTPADVEELRESLRRGLFLPNAARMAIIHALLDTLAEREAEERAERPKAPCSVDCGSCGLSGCEHHAAGPFQP